jgi:predicted phosphodiesterase
MPSLDRVAVVSDVHGNLTALEAVLADLDARGITRIVNLGDVVGKGPRGAACVRLVRERDIATIQGNWEAFLSDGRDHGPGPQWWRDELDPGQLDWLAALPFCDDLVMSGRRVRMLHASPQGVFQRVSYRHTHEQYAGMFLNTPHTGDGPAPTCVLYGEIHGTYLEGDDNQTLVNVGSVGNPLDATTASYVVLEGVADSPEPEPFGIQFIRVPFDTEAEIALAEARGMPEAREYAVELRTGLYRGYQEGSPRP